MWAASNSVRSVKTRFRLPISPAAEKTNMRPALFDSTFVTLGKGRLACIKRIPSENAAFLFAKAPMAQPRHIVFVRGRQPVNSRHRYEGIRSGECRGPATGRGVYPLEEINPQKRPLPLRYVFSFSAFNQHQPAWTAAAASASGM